MRVVLLTPTEDYEQNEPDSRVIGYCSLTEPKGYVVVIGAHHFDVQGWWCEGEIGEYSCAPLSVVVYSHEPILLLPGLVLTLDGSWQ